jgi:hypothetical protein
MAQQGDLPMVQTVGKRGRIAEQGLCGSLLLHLAGQIVMQGLDGALYKCFSTTNLS